MYVNVGVSTMREHGRLLSLVFRLERAKLEALKDLSKSTRNRQSEYLREAISDLLVKYEQSAAQNQMVRSRKGGSAGKATGRSRSAASKGSTVEG